MNLRTKYKGHYGPLAVIKGWATLDSYRILQQLRNLHSI
jgi:hypothetical protein